MRYEWTDDKDNVHLLSEKELSLESATYYNNTFYVLQNGVLNKYLENGSFEEIFTPTVFKRIYGDPTHFLAVSKDGEVYYYEKSTGNFLVQKIVYAGIRQTCEHGVQGIPRVLKVKSVCLTETSAVFVCQDGQLWSFNSSVFEAKTEVIYATKIELNKCAYKVRQLVAGRKHCVALVDFASANNQSKNENNVVTECQKCRDFENLRLSTLMEAADEKYVAKDENKEDIESSAEQTPSKPGLDRFFSSFKYPFFKKLSVRSRGPQSRWYAMPPGSSRTFSDTDNSSENGVGGIELSTWHSSQQANSNSLGLNGSVAFSFVSLDNLVSSSDDSSVGHAETDLSTLDQSLLSNNFHSFVSPQVANTFCEVWAWGANDLGQLGAGNAVPTRIPKRVKVPQGPVIKISAGYDHTLALLSTGEVYGWGSNKNGQLKIDSAEFISEPILLKLGSKVCVIDATAGGDVSTVIVNSEDNSNVVACRFSRSHSSSSNGVTSRLDCLEKLGCPLNITAFDGGNKLLVGYLKSDCKKVENAVQTLCRVLLSVRASCQLSQLAQNIKEKAEREPLNHVSGTLWHWSAVLSRVAELLLFSVTVNGSVDLMPSSTCDLTFDAVLKAMLKMHFARIDAVAQGCFHDLNLRDEIKKQVDQLSLEHETESSKDFKRLIGLFAVPQKQFLSLHGVINTILTPKS
ncbi:unnamed protein product [Bursaphelenchus xylophilus]|uniref:(pine wood nematode) hypothetical protein n=1 Tax=Bursaphelenchus xylophilus TaxID=6326 RepID=A0A1I7RP09_BURXY|nr:unnamed protein product [Bursaphelenchus xylophilus]CAG9124434.1 unnamed protein product [Bursaphelenchus xylophilus]